MMIKIQPVEDAKPAAFKPHPLADLFPMMDEDAFLDFASDVEKHGQREPIILYEDMVLDGRNRLKACEMLGFTPKFKDYTGNDPAGFVISLNLKRRHLTESQRALVAKRLATMKQGQRTDIPSKEGKSISQADAARILNVSVASVERAAKVEKHGVPELITAVEKGDISISLAAEIAKEPAEVQQYVMTPSQEKELSTALKRFQNAKEMRDEAERFVPPAPLTEEEKSEQVRVFGTPETRGVIMDLLNAGKMVAKLPSPETVVGFVPLGMENIVTDNTNAMREVSKWFDAFVNAWQAKE